MSKFFLLFVVLVALLSSCGGGGSVNINPNDDEHLPIADISGVWHVTSKYGNETLTHKWEFQKTKTSYTVKNISNPTTYTCTFASSGSQITVIQDDQRAPETWSCSVTSDGKGMINGTWFYMVNGAKVSGTFTAAKN